ncbi:hypothetical protein [Kitasatospora sp. Root107]|uniref:hypothetical protein n=1 Tax=Kitasatospora sp. Root107 TaxID=1736424 RepID=UPI0007153177|nr:hypothetical protein [Kitasatospora sp. Root107]KQV12073.1 hypothetical protein ASC99_35205 [Kitasatospora sp. Root107]
MTVITVQYDGGSSGSGPLTFGQDNMILCIRRDDPDQINKQAVWPVPPGAGLPEVLAVLRQLAERHESLRTRFPSDGPGGGTRQVVHAAGSFRVTLVEAGPEGELDALGPGGGLPDPVHPADPGRPAGPAGRGGLPLRRGRRRHLPAV